MSVAKRARDDHASPSVLEIISLVKRVVGSTEGLDYKESKRIFDLLESEPLDVLARELKSLTAFVGFSPEETWCEFNRVLTNFNKEPTHAAKGYTAEALALVILIVLIHRGTNPGNIIGRCGPGLGEILKDLVSMGFKKNIPPGGNKQKALIFSRIAACQPVLSNLVVQHFGLSSLGESAREGISPRFASPALYSALPILSLTKPTSVGVAGLVAVFYAVCYQTNFSHVLSNLTGSKTQTTPAPQSVFIRNAMNSTALTLKERIGFFLKRMCKDNANPESNVVVNFIWKERKHKITTRTFEADPDAVKDFLEAAGLKGIRIGDFGISTDTVGDKSVMFEFPNKVIGLDASGNLIVNGELYDSEDTMEP